MPAKPSDKFIPWYFVAFFMVLTVIFSAFGYVAHHTYTGLVTDDSYQKGIKYNDIIAKAAEQQKLGWHMALASTHAGNRATVSLHLTGADGAKVSGAKVKLWIVRPVQAGMDQRLEMTPDASGVNYTASADLPAPGLWELRVEAAKDGAISQLSQRAEF